MKQEIIEKLINDQELTKEEIIFVARNLNDNKPTIPYNHDANSTTAEACGVEVSDGEKLNKLFKEAMEGSESKSISEIVETTEGLVQMNPKYLRLVIIQAVKAAQDHMVGDPISRFLDHLAKSKKKNEDDNNTPKNEGE